MSSSSTSNSTLRELSDDLAGAVARVAPSVVAVHARQRIPASAILWRDGVVVGAHHTIKRDEDIPVTLADGSRTNATVAGRDPGTDLVVLRVPSGLASSEPATLRAADEVPRVGELVLAVGRPGEDGVTATLGIVSAAQGPWRSWHGGDIDRFIRSDLTVYDGFSGSPLVDAKGAVLGLNSSALARGMAVTLPVATVERVVGQLLTRGHVARGYLGLAMQPVRITESLRQRMGGKITYEAGAMVVKVEAGGPADRAGILLGDVLVAVDGSAVTDPEEVSAALGGDAVGRKLAATVVRGGALVELSVTVGERPRGGRGGEG
jgi:serine protease DegQ